MMRTHGLDGEQLVDLIMFFVLLHLTLHILSVCGKTHPSPIPVFWLQCETCEAWHNVSPECVGFDQAAADDMSAWSCWNCNPPIAGLEK
jgi:hypothetical protein